MLLPALFYIAWDSWFTSLGVWRFSKDHITGSLLFNLPAEEVLFFFVVPYCCVFIYECIRCYFPSIKNTHAAELVLKTTGLVLFIAGMIFYDRYYTFYTFLFSSLFILVFFVFRKFFSGFNVTAFLISYVVILIPFLVVNGFLTAIPVVIYNDAENLGIRIYTIPFEDVFYGMLLIMMNIAGFERLRNKKV